MVRLSLYELLNFYIWLHIVFPVATSITVFWSYYLIGCDYRRQSLNSYFYVLVYQVNVHTKYNHVGLDNVFSYCYVDLLVKM